MPPPTSLREVRKLTGPLENAAAVGWICVVWFYVVLCCVALCGSVWCGSMWFFVVWLCVVLCGVVLCGRSVSRECDVLMFLVWFVDALVFWCSDVLVF